jgi:hypothetical protein
MLFWLDPLPNPVPPVPHTESLTTVKNPQESLTPAPIPPAFMPTMADNEPRSTAWSVTFESVSYETAALASSATKVIALLETLIVVVALIDIAEKWMIPTTFEMTIELSK